MSEAITILINVVFSAAIATVLVEQYKLYKDPK